MRYKVADQQNVEMKPCVCGGYPDFIEPNIHYTDCWLQCSYCGRRTKNTGGFHYAEEIPILRARLKAVELWNERKYEE